MLGYRASATLVPGLWANPIAVGVSFAVIGAVGVGWNVVTVSLRQAIVPDELLGRVNSAYRLLGLGHDADRRAARRRPRRAFGLRAPFIVGGFGCIVVGFAIIPWVNNRTIAAARAAAA